MNLWSARVWVIITLFWYKYLLNVLIKDAQVIELQCSNPLQTIEITPSLSSCQTWLDDNATALWINHVLKEYKSFYPNFTSIFVVCMYFVFYFVVKTGHIWCPKFLQYCNCVIVILETNNHPVLEHTGRNNSCLLFRKRYWLYSWQTKVWIDVIRTSGDIYVVQPLLKNGGHMS